MSEEQLNVAAIKFQYRNRTAVVLLQAYDAEMVKRGILVKVKI